MKKIARPELIATLIARIQHAQEGVRASLLTSIWTTLLPHMTDDEKTDFYKFYQQMLLGMEAEAREHGAQPKTVDELEAKIDSLSNVPESTRVTCGTMMNLMRPPSPLNL